MKYIQSIELVNELALNINELIKEPTRTERFLDKLINNPNFTLDNDRNKSIYVTNGQEIYDAITTNNSFDSQKAKEFFISKNRYKAVFNTIDQSYKLNDLFKDSDFMGKIGGNAKLNEIAKYVQPYQCLFLALRQYNKADLRSNSYEKFKDTELFNLLIEKIDSPSINELSYNHFRMNFMSWNETLFKSANAIFNNGILDYTKKYIFINENSKSKVTSSIRRKFLELRKQLGTNIKIDINKWCPDDIWIVNQKNNKFNEIVYHIDLSNDFNELNTNINYYLESQDLIGVSLKKLSKTVSPKVIFNKHEKLPTFKFISFSKSEPMIKSQGTYLIAKPGKKNGDDINKINIRNNLANSKSNIVFEIVGKSARHGKIVLNKYLQII